MSFPERLESGYRAFLSGRLRSEQDRYRELSVHGQSPQIMVISCCDSRCAPEAIFDAGPGELFVVRNIANIVPPYQPDQNAHGVSAALEFGVGALRVKHIVVLGHARCGGVRAFAEDIDNSRQPLSAGDFIGKWMTLMAPAADKIGPRGDDTLEEYQTRLELANIRNSLDNLMTFPRLRQEVENGDLRLHGAYFGVATGELAVRDPNTGAFTQVAADEYGRLFSGPRF
jgi:carbonic anhydrase